MKYYVTLNHTESDSVFDFYGEGNIRQTPDIYYILKKNDIDCLFDIASINITVIEGAHYNFTEVFEVKENYYRVVLYDMQTITLMFDTEEEALYFKLKYGGV